jgi:mannose-6-phosphate isomerase-like protein (cupin superfamily)
MKKKNNFYCNKVVYKPWGYEYVVYSDSNRLAITFVKINYGHKTSLHCHPQKKTGFIILDGKALVQIGIYKENSKCFRTLSRLVFRPGLFHSIKAISKQGICALEFETPFKKNDLVRFTDDYGRQSKHYEGKKFTKNIGSNFIKFKKPKLGKKRKYNFKNLEILIEVRKNLKNLVKKDDKTTSAILDGNIVDNNGQNVISYGEIVKTSTLRILSDVFEIRKPLTILRVSKKINSTKANKFN